MSSRLVAEGRIVASRFLRPVTAAQIRATPEWHPTYPAARVVFVQDANEGDGAGFDNLDLGASAWTFFQVTSTWEDIAEAYARHFAGLGWQRHDAGGRHWTHQVWMSAAHPGESIAVTHRPPQPRDSWSANPEGGTVFSVFHRVDPAPSSDGTPDA
jgi:hypothetical protein